MRPLPPLVACLLFSACASPALAPVQEQNVPRVLSGAVMSSVSSQPMSPSPEEVTIPSLTDLPIQGTDFTVGQKLATNSAYDRYAISYRSNGILVTGVMNIPKGTESFPLLILNHGYIDPKIYTTGRGLKREQDYLARNGFAVIHIDYRGHAGSDPNPDNRIGARYVGYAVDALAVVDAVRRNPPAHVNAAKIGMLGHSLGGGVSLMAAVSHPSFVNAIVLYAPVSGDAWKNFDRWESKDRAGELAIEILGTPDTNPQLWKEKSPASYYDRLTAPVIIFHGTMDNDVPYAWSEETEQQLKAAGKDVRFITYTGEGHEFGTHWTDFMKQTAKSFHEQLDAQ